VIRTRPLPGPPLDPTPYDLVCVTSANAVPLLFERLAAGGRDARALAGARDASIGAATTRALSEHGIAADVTAERAVGEGLVEALADVPVSHALVARARDARDVVPEALRSRGAQVDVVDLYETVAEPLAPGTLALAQGADYITFTSSSTVRNFLLAAAGRARDGGGDRSTDRDGRGRAGLSPQTRVVSIGPVTSETLREHGLDVDIEAARHDVDGVLEALLADAAVRAT
jgi:uroporphyrinogen III methyltransferase/synthase